MQHTKELAPRIVLMWDDETGIARIENYLTGLGHAAHPNIKRPRSAEDMKRREAWGKDDRVVQSHSFLYNIDRLSIHEPLDDVARQHCQCGGNHATQRWYDFPRRVVPSPMPISIAPDRTKIYWRRGAMCQSLK